MAIEVYIPKMSDHMEFGEIVQWLVQEGERVEVDQPILELMTDKAVTEVVAPASGVLKGIRSGAEAGAQVPVGETVAFIAQADEDVPILPPLNKELVQEEMVAASAEPIPEPRTSGKIRATPAARRLAKDLGVDLALVQGSEATGRIHKEDVLAAHEGLSTPLAEGDFPGDQWLDLSPVERRTGEQMLQSVRTAPQFVLSVDVDMTNTLWLRDAMLDQIQAETGERLSITAILVKLVALSLGRFPRVNSSFEDGRLHLHSQINVGVAMETGAGLVVPVIKRADERTLVEIASDLVRLRKNAGEKRLRIEDLDGGTFTISNLGMHGIDRFTAIVNPPQSAILAVGRVARRPVVLADASVAGRPMASFSLTVDHRSMGGMPAAIFLSDIRQRVEKPWEALR